MRERGEEGVYEGRGGKLRVFLKREPVGVWEDGGVVEGEEGRRDGNM